MSSEPESTDSVSTDPASADSVSGEVVGADEEAVVGDHGSEDSGARPPFRPRRARAFAGAALALVTLAGIGCTAFVVHGADRSAHAPVWRLPKPERKAGDTEKQTGLRALLLPYDEDRYDRGPDMGEYGSDVELTGGQTAELLRESLKDLPRSQRLRLERGIGKKPVKGIAMRSYARSAWTGPDSGPFSVHMVLTRADRNSLRARNRSQKDFLDTMKIFRKGPEIKGHEDHAACFLPPADREAKLEVMSCSGYVGDIGVSALVEATAPLDRKGVAEMIRAQFDRIQEPGEAV